jgi:transketolase
MGMYRKTRLNFGALAGDGSHRAVDEETRSIMEDQSERLYGETKTLLAARKPLTKSATSTSVSTRSASSSVARRMAKAVSRLGGAAAPVAASSNGAGKPVAV